MAIVQNIKLMKLCFITLNMRIFVHLISLKIVNNLILAKYFPLIDLIMLVYIFMYKS